MVVPRTDRDTHDSSTLAVASGFHQTFDSCRRRKQTSLSGGLSMRRNHSADLPNEGFPAEASGPIGQQRYSCIRLRQAGGGKASSCEPPVAVSAQPRRPSFGENAEAWPNRPTAVDLLSRLHLHEYTSSSLLAERNYPVCQWYEESACRGSPNSSRPFRLTSYPPGTLLSSSRSGNALG